MDIYSYFFEIWLVCHSFESWACIFFLEDNQTTFFILVRDFFSGKAGILNSFRMFLQTVGSMLQVVKFCLNEEFIIFECFPQWFNFSIKFAIFCTEEITFFHRKRIPPSQIAVHVQLRWTSLPILGCRMFRAACTPEPKLRAQLHRGPWTAEIHTSRCQQVIMQLRLHDFLGHISSERYTQWPT